MPKRNLKSLSVGSNVTIDLRKVRFNKHHLWNLEVWDKGLIGPDAALVFLDEKTRACLKVIHRQPDSGTFMNDQFTMEVSVYSLLMMMRTERWNILLALCCERLKDPHRIFVGSFGDKKESDVVTVGAPEKERCNSPYFRLNFRKLIPDRYEEMERLREELRNGNQ